MVIMASGSVAKFVPIAAIPTESGSGHGEQCFDRGFLINAAHRSLSSCKDRVIVSQQCHLGVFNLVRGREVWASMASIRLPRGSCRKGSARCPLWLSLGVTKFD